MMMLWLGLVGLGCDTRTRVITEGERMLYSEDLNGQRRFESGDPLLIGSSFCLEREHDDQNACLSMNGFAPYEEVGFCFGFDALGMAEVEIAPADCEGDTGWETPDLLRLDVISAEGLTARLAWPVEEQAASMAENPLYEVLGPDFAVPGAVPSADVTLWIWPQALLPVYLSVWDGEQEVAWASPWRVDVEEALRDGEVWRFSGGGGRIAVVAGSVERIEAQSWQVADLSAEIDERLHVAIAQLEKEDFKARVDEGDMPVPGISAFLESTGPNGEVIKGQPVEWTMRGVSGAHVKPYDDPGAVEVDLFCAAGWRSRNERVTLEARTAAGTHRESFWVRIPQVPRDTQSKENFEAFCGALEPELSGCSQVPGRALWFPGVVAVLGLMFRRRRP